MTVAEFILKLVGTIGLYFCYRLSLLLSGHTKKRLKNRMELINPYLAKKIVLFFEVGKLRYAIGFIIGTVMLWVLKW